MRRVILTFSGKVPQSEGSLIWKKVAGVMEAAGANIETAGGSFVRMPRVIDDAGDAHHAQSPGVSTLSVSAFGACIEPSRPLAAGRLGAEDHLGCTMYIKALLPDSNVAPMMALLEGQSPTEVYTVSLSRDATLPTSAGKLWDSQEFDSPGEYVVTHEAGTALFDTASAGKGQRLRQLEAGQHVCVLEVAQDASETGQVWGRIAEPAGWTVLTEAGEKVRLLRKADRTSGTVYLFGVDRPGQLAAITKLLSEQHVAILHLRVQSGIPDSDKCDFVHRTGGPLAENRLRIVFDGSTTDLTTLRTQIQQVGDKIGYAVTCLTTDGQSQLRAWWPSYLLRRKAFTVAFAAARASEEALERGRRARRRSVMRHWRKRMQHRGSCF